MRTTSIWIGRLRFSLAALVLWVLLPSRLVAQSLPVVISGGADHVVKRMTERGILGHALGAHPDRVTALALVANAQEKILVSGSADGKISVWNLAQDRLILSQEAHLGGVTAAAIAPDGRLIATTGADGTLRLWNREKGRRLASLPLNAKEPRALFFALDGKRLQLADATTLYTWQVTIEAKGAIRLVAETPQTLGVEGIRSARIAPDGKTLALGSEDAFVSLYSLTGKRVVKRFQASEFPIVALAWTPDGKSLACGDDRGNFRIWNVEDGKPRLFLCRTRALLRALAFSKDGKFLVSGSEDGAIHYWETLKGKPVARLDAHRGGVTQLVVLP